MRRRAVCGRADTPAGIFRDSHSVEGGRALVLLLLAKGKLVLTPSSSHRDCAMVEVASDVLDAKDVRCMRAVLAPGVLRTASDVPASSSSSELDELVAELRAREELHARDEEELRAFRALILRKAYGAGRDDLVRSLS